MNFDEVSQQHLALKQKLNSNIITRSEYEATLNNLIAVAPDGKRWQIDPQAGTWVEVGSGKAQEVQRKRESPGPETLLQLLALMGKNMVKSLPKLILIGLFMSLLTWVLHTYIIAVINDGLMFVSNNNVVNAVVRLQSGDNPFRGVSAFWGVIGYFVTSFLFRASSFGLKKWSEGIVSLPDNIKTSVNNRKNGAWSSIILGASLALLIALLFNNFMLSWVLAFGLLLVMTARFESMEMVVLKLGLGDLQKIIKRQMVPKGEENHSIFLFILGLCGGFFLAALWGPRAAWIFITAILMISLYIFLVAKGNTVQKFAAMLLTILGAAIFLDPQKVLAWCEGGSFSRVDGWGEWWNYTNSDVVRRLGFMPAASSFVGSAIGGAGVATAPELTSGLDGGAQERTPMEIYENPRPLDRFVGGDGKEYIYYKPVGDTAPEPFWTSIDDYNNDMWHLEQGHVYQDGGWMEADLAAQRRDWQENMRRETARRHEEATARYEELLDRKAEQRLEAEGKAEYYQNLLERMESGRHILSGNENEAEMMAQLKEISEYLREKGEIDAVALSKISALQNEIVPHLRDHQAKAEQEMDRANKVAHRWDVATRGVEAVKSIADTSIDVLAKVTGPKGKTIRRAYRALSNIAGGLSEGYATGEYGRSMLEASARILDGEIGDRLGNASKKAQIYHQVGSGMVRGGYEGYMNMAEGDTVMGAISLGALEGGASSASSALKDSLGGVDKKVYSAYETMYKAAYNEFKSGGSIQSVQDAVQNSLLGSLRDEAVDFMGTRMLDGIIPQSEAVSRQDMFRHIQKIAAEIPDDHQAQQLIADLTRDWIYDVLEEEGIKAVRSTTLDATKSTVKGEGLFTYYQDLIKLF